MGRWTEQGRSALTAGHPEGTKVEDGRILALPEPRHCSSSLWTSELQTPRLLGPRAWGFALAAAGLTGPQPRTENCTMGPPVLWPSWCSSLQRALRQTSQPL